MFCDVPIASKILEGYQKLPVSGYRPLTPKMQTIIAKAYKPKRGVPITDDFFENASIPSPIAIISTPIIIAPCLPAVSSQPQTIVSYLTPMFTDSTATTSTTNMTNEPPVTINTSDVGVGASVLTIGHSTTLISSLRQDDLDTFLKGDEFEFRSFQFNPFRFQEDSDDDAPVTQRQFKVIT
ncbi:unnamed protein product [Lactuca saligna]|uniref:Uncharacterized protein n=1 Tax=Lactuca saligna TaxID=75948 RepID=A0AA36EPS7_LACSI|nr:unnamed protein product [Lactuca saligna]